jgi:hypothetical protein
MAQATVTRLTRDQVKELGKELNKRIVTGDNDAMLNYVTEISRIRRNAQRVGLFKQWSMRNYRLLLTQAHAYGEQHVGMYAGAEQFARVNRAVRPGAVAKYIWAPVPLKSTRKADAATTAATTTAATAAPVGAASAAADDTEPQGRTSYGFRLVDVYDWSDTMSTDPDFVEPNWATPFAAGDDATLGQLAASSPVPVHFADLGGSLANGWLDASGITVNTAMPVGNRIWTLIHELAHFHLGHLALIGDTRHSGGDVDAVRAQCEQEASATQFVTMKMLGLDEEVGNDVTTAAANYLRSWCDPDTGDEIAGHKRRGKLLDARLDAAFAAANIILDGFQLAGVAGTAPAAVTA